MPQVGYKGEATVIYWTQCFEIQGINVCDSRSASLLSLVFFRSADVSIASSAVAAVAGKYEAAKSFNDITNKAVSCLPED